MSWTKVETELAKVVVDELRERGWKVYQEVDVGGSVCDIVAVSGRVLWAIECKTSLGLPVLAQAKGWETAANLISVAVLPGRRSDARKLARETAEMIGVGVLEVHGPDDYDWMLGSWMRSKVRPGRVCEVVRPARRRLVLASLRNNLRDEQQHYAEAGNADGKRWTPYMATCQALRKTLELDGPLTIRHAVARLAGRHHYASELSARGALYKWAKAGRIPGVVLIPGGKGKPAMLGLAKASTPTT